MKYQPVPPHEIMEGDCCFITHLGIPDKFYSVMAGSISADSLLLLSQRGLVFRTKEEAVNCADDLLAPSIKDVQNMTKSLKIWPEHLGSTCMDGGTCHHDCKDKCFRRECCVPLTLALDAGLSMEQWRYPEAAPQAVQDAEPETREALAKRLITDVQVANTIATSACQRVAELPDRASPTNWPEAMLVTGDELHMIVREAVIEAQTTPAEEVPAQIETLREELAEETEAAENWRRLALQFDNHRLQALGHLKAVVNPGAVFDAYKAAKAFLNAPPLGGEEVLAQRLAELAAPVQGWKLVPVELLERIQESLGSFVSDQGWSQSDIDTADTLDGLLAAAPHPTHSKTLI